MLSHPLKEIIMSLLIDIKALKADALAAINKEGTEKAKTALITQLRVVENCKRVLRAEEVKLSDLEARIAEGTL